MIRPLLALLLGSATLTAAAADEPGFKSIFHGQDRTGGDGRPGFWSVKDGHIRGETTPANRAPGNPFLIWREGALQNFALQIHGGGPVTEDFVGGAPALPAAAAAEYRNIIPIP